MVITYNHENYIRDTLTGILRQQVNNKKIEIIICDDNSKDNTRAIINEFLGVHNNIKVHFSTTQLGVINNFIYGLSNCIGDYILFCEGDDYWTDANKIEYQVNFLNCNPDFIVSFHNARVIDILGNTITSSKLPDNCKKDFSKIELQKGAFLLSVSLCFRNIIREYPPEMKNVLNGDIFLVSLLGRYGKAKYQPEIEPAVCRVHEGGVWSTKPMYDRNKHSQQTQYQLYLYHKRMKSPGEVIHHFTSTYLYYSFELAQHEFNQGKYILSMARYLKLLFRALQMGSPKYFRRYLVKPVYLITRGKNKPDPIVS